MNSQRVKKFISLVAIYLLASTFFKVVEVAVHYPVKPITYHMLVCVFVSLILFIREYMRLCES